MYIVYLQLDALGVPFLGCPWCAVSYFRQCKHHFEACVFFANRLQIGKFEKNPWSLNVLQIFPDSPESDFQLLCSGKHSRPQSLLYPALHFRPLALQSLV